MVRKIRIQKGIEDNTSLGVYFVIPVNVEEDFSEELKKLNVFRKERYFDYMTSDVKVENTEYFDPYGKLIINLRDLSEDFQRNFLDVVDLENTEHVL